MNNRKCIVIVDDSTVQRKSIEAMLKSAGFEVKGFGNGVDVLEYLSSVKDNLPVAVVTDMNMPDMDGLELSRRINCKYANKIGVVALTAYVDEFTIKEAFDSGVLDYIEKPSHKIELITRIVNVVRIIENEKKLKENEKRLKDILESIHAGIIIIDAETHKIVDVNPMAESMIGISKGDIVNNICHKFICPAEEGKCPITDLGHKVDNSERILLSKGDKEIPILKTVTSTTISGRVHLVESFLDITEIRKMQEELKILSTTDFLTGLYNRRHFLELFEKEFSRALRFDKKISFMMLDLDHFKKINDTYGHHAGDKALVTFSDLTKSLLRKYDILCRFGGEEFAIFCPETSTEEAALVAERIRKEIEKNTILYDGMEIKLTVSIGIAEFIHSDKEVDDIIKRADKALYKAKFSGRNNVCLL
jgi:diguanylate cyclase (GGDEF)-like protein/PAS domain S-box-containing protein